jgi:hypothetical protein
MKRHNGAPITTPSGSRTPRAPLPRSCTTTPQPQQPPNGQTGPDAWEKCDLISKVFGTVSSTVDDLRVWTALAAAGTPVREIAEVLGAGRSTVYRALQRAARTGTCGEETS